MPGVTGAIHLGIAIPQTFPGATIDPARIRAFLTRAEALGFHSAWVVEQILGRIPSLEPVELLTYAAALNPVFDDAEHLERFAADIAPKLSA
jgi:hypothetical protein